MRRQRDAAGVWIKRKAAKAGGYGRSPNLTRAGPGRIASHVKRRTGVKVWRLLARAHP